VLYLFWLFTSIHCAVNVCMWLLSWEYFKFVLYIMLVLVFFWSQRSRISAMMSNLPLLELLRLLNPIGFLKRAS